MEQGLARITMKADADYLAEIGSMESRSYLAPVKDLLEAVKKRLATKVDSMLGMPWGGKSPMRFAPGRWTLWSGPTHHGKSALLNLLALHGAKTGHKFLICAMEEDAEAEAKELAALVLTERQALWHDSALNCAFEWMDDKVWLFTHSGFVAPDLLLGAAIHAAKHHGVTHVVIDSLMMLDIRKDDYNGQRELGAKLNRVTKQYGIHIHIVAHPTKAIDHTRPMETSDVAGAQELGALAHSIAIVQRAPRAAKLRAEWDIKDGTDGIINITKQRGDLNFVGIFELAYLAKYRQLALSREDGPRRFMPDSWYQDLGIEIGGLINPLDDPWGKEF